MPPEDQSGGAPFTLYRTILPLSVSAALSETPGWLATALVGLALVADGYSTAVAGTIASLPAAGVIAMSTILPGIARSFGVVPVFYSAAVLLVTSLLLLVAAANDGALWLWCLGSFGVGLGASMRWVLTDGFVNHIATSGQRGRLLAFHESIRSCALGLGPLIASFTTENPATGFMIGIGATLIGAVLTVGMHLPQVTTGRAHLSDLTTGLRLAPFAFAVAFLGGVLEGVAAAAVPLYAVALGVGAAAGALLAALSGFGNILGQLPFGAYADLNGSRPAIRGALILAMLALAILHAVMSVPIAAYAVIICFGAAAGALYTLSVLEASTTASHEVGMISILATIAIVYTLGDLVGPIIGGIALDVAPPLAMPAIFVAACAITLFFARKGRGNG
jgi:MFS family permease